MTLATPLAVRGIDHVVIRTANIEAMLTFYRGVLGCPLERRVERLGLYQLRAGNALIDLVDADSELGRRGGGPPGTEARNMDHLCLQIAPWDAEQITAYLEQHGIAPGPVEARYGAGGSGPSIYITDPDGNGIELKGPAAAS